MKKDITIPLEEGVQLVVIHEYNEEFLSMDWNAYIINHKKTAIEMVMVVSKGYHKDRNTATMRHGIQVLAAKSSEKIELLQEAVLGHDKRIFSDLFF